MEELFIKIEEEIANSVSIEELKKVKMEYINNHRMVLEYFVYVQEAIEQEAYGNGGY